METHDSQNHPSDEQNSMDAIRELLMGQKTREIDNQIGDVERRLQSMISELEQRLNNRFDSLEQYVKGELGSAKEQFTAGTSEQERRAHEAGEKVKSLGETLNERFGGFEEKLNKIENEGRSQVFERTKALSDEIAENSRRLHEKIDGELHNLRQSTTKKNELSEMLIELGMRMQPQDHQGGEHHHHG